MFFKKYYYITECGTKYEWERERNGSGTDVLNDDDLIFHKIFS